MTDRRYFPFTYGAVGRQDRPAKVSLTRDGHAAMILGQHLNDLGFRCGGPIINYPLPKGVPCPTVPLSPLGDWHRKYGPDDVILVPTRLPLDDDNEPDRRGSRPSYTQLEQHLFVGMRSRFEKLCRTVVHLDPRTARISDELAARQSMVFHQNCGATYQGFGSPVTGVWRRFKVADGLTVGFLVYAEHAWPGGPALLAAFGMGGMDTLVWCHLLATRYADLLCTTSFAMAEISTVGWPERPESMDFVQDVKVEILGVAPSKPRRAA
jgi:hypothetical protein